MPDLDHPFASDEKAGGDALDTVLAGHNVMFIHQSGERQSQSLGVRLHSSPAFSYVHGQDDELVVTVLFVGTLESGPLSPAVGSPGGPEVEEYRLASQVAQQHLLAAEIGQRKVRSTRSLDRRDREFGHRRG